MKSASCALVLSLTLLFLQSNSMANEVTLSGPVVEMKWATGSHSEHIAVVLKSSEGSFKLRRPGGNPFHDPELNRYIGKSWTCTGTLIGARQFMLNHCVQNEDLMDDSAYQLN